MFHFTYFQVQWSMDNARTKLFSMDFYVDGVKKSLGRHVQCFFHSNCIGQANFSSFSITDYIELILLYFFSHWTQVNKTETSPNVITCVLEEYKKSEFAQRDCRYTTTIRTGRPSVHSNLLCMRSHVYWARIQLCWHHYSLSRALYLYMYR